MSSRGAIVALLVLSIVISEVQNYTSFSGVIVYGNGTILASKNNDTIIKDFHVNIDGNITDINWRADELDKLYGKSNQEEPANSPTSNQDQIDEDPSTHNGSLVQISNQDQIDEDPSIHNGSIVQISNQDQIDEDPSIHGSLVRLSDQDQIYEDPSTQNGSLVQISNQDQIDEDPSIHGSLVRLSDQDQKYEDPSIHNGSLVQISNGQLNVSSKLSHLLLCVYFSYICKVIRI